MKKLIFIIALGALPALAGVTTISTMGSAEGYCDSDSNGTMCIQDLQNQADQQANQQAQIQCEEQRGIVGGPGICTHNCNPPEINDGAITTYVTCESNCTSQCETRN